MYLFKNKNNLDKNFKKKLLIIIKKNSLIINIKSEKNINESI